MNGTMPTKKCILLFVVSLFLLPFVLSDACDVTFLNNNVLTYYLFNETSTTYYNDVGNSNFDLDTGNDPTRVSQSWGYGADFEHDDSDYLKTSVTSTDFELNKTDTNYTLAFHFIPEEDEGDQSVIFNTLKLSGSYRGQMLQFRTDETFAIFEYYGNGNSYYYTKASTQLTYGTHYYVVMHLTTGSNKIWLNDTEVGYTTQQGGRAQFWNNLHQFELGANADGRYIDGVVGSYAIYNVTLNESCRNYTRDNQYLFFQDNTPPELSLIYPINNTRYNNYNDSIIINATDIGIGMGNCTINNSNWIQTGNDGVLFRFDRVATPDGNYSFLVECNDTSDNSDTINFNFLIDTINPTINVFSPLNNSIYNSDILINVSFYDIYLYQTRMYINRNDSKIDSVSVIAGTQTDGDINSFDTIDGDFLNVSETAKSDIRFNYTGIQNFTGFGIYFRYFGNPAHNVFFQWYNYDSSVWDSYITLASGGIGWENYSMTSFGIDSYMYVDNNTGLMQGRIYHDSNPTGSHWFAVDEIFINGTERYWYYNYSDILLTDYYNVSEYFDITYAPDGEYELFLESSDTHTGKYFNDILYTESGYTSSYKNYYKKYYMKHGEIEILTPPEINIVDLYEHDRVKQKFDSILNIDLEEIEIEIIADKLIYFEDSNYNCHLILNDWYWYDCQGLSNAEIVSITPTSATFKFFHSIIHDTSDSLGGLNYINTSYFFTIDTITPNVTNNVITNGTNVLTYLFNFSEWSNYYYSIGIDSDCSDSSVSSGSGTGTYFQDITIGLNASVYYINVSIEDNATNYNEYCFNGTPTATGIDYTIIQGIVETALEEEVEKMNEGLIIVILFILWAILLAFSYIAKTSAGVVLTSIFGIFSSIWMYNSTDVPRLVTVTFALICCYIIYLVFKMDE